MVVVLQPSLVQACFNGDPDEVRAILYKKEDVNYQVVSDAPASCVETKTDVLGVRCTSCTGSAASSYAQYTHSPFPATLVSKLMISEYCYTHTQSLFPGLRG